MTNISELKKGCGSVIDYESTIECGTRSFFCVKLCPSCQIKLKQLQKEIGEEKTKEMGE